jgi:hypothetical protein
MSYSSPDGLLLKFGTEKAVAQKAGEYRTNGRLHEVECKITLTALADAAAIPTGTDLVLFPSGARIEEIEVVGETAATSAGSAVLNIGLVREDRTTAYDDDGFVAALAKTAIDAAGEKNVIRVGSSGAGALIGTTLANKGYLSANYDTAAFTAGVVVVTVRYYIP